MKRNVDVRGHYKTKTSKTQKKLERQKEADEALLTWVLVFGKGVALSRDVYAWMGWNSGTDVPERRNILMALHMHGYVSEDTKDLMRSGSRVWAWSWAVTKKGLTRLNELTREEANKTKAKEKLAKYKQLFTNQGGARDR